MSPASHASSSPSRPRESHSKQPSLHIPSGAISDFDALYSDSREHGSYKGPLRNVRIPRVTSGGGAIARNEDGTRCVVAAKECLRILRLSEPSHGGHSDHHKSSVGRSGHRVDASRNFWEGSGLKIDSVSTDVAWGHGVFNHKIITSARNGELILWDLNKSGPSKYERRSRDHMRSIQKMSYSTLVHHYCITGSADGDVRVWDLRDSSKSIMRIHHPSSVRTLVFSPDSSYATQAAIGLDNGTIYRWDLKMGQRGQLDRIPVAHAGPILALDWCCYNGASVPTPATASSSPAPSIPVAGTSSRNSIVANWSIGEGTSGATRDRDGAVAGGKEVDGKESWIASGGLDHCVKVWRAPPSGHISQKPTYTLKTAFPVRRVRWRPDYPTELAVVSNAEQGTGSGISEGSGPPIPSAGGFTSSGSAGTLRPSGGSSASLSSKLTALGDALGRSPSWTSIASGGRHRPRSGTDVGDSNTGRGVFQTGDPIEVWDVRRGFIAKWAVGGSAVEGGVSDAVWNDSHCLWAQHVSGTFSQLDTRYSSRPIDAIPRATIAWSATGSITFATDQPRHWEVPFDDIEPNRRETLLPRKLKLKRLGDPSHVPATQGVGTCPYDVQPEDLEVFLKQARGYIFEGSDKRSVCHLNAQTAFEAGNEDGGQTWMLVASLMTDIMPELPPLTKPFVSPALPHSTSAPSTIPTIHHTSPPSRVPPKRSLTTEPLRILGKETTVSGSASTRSTPKHDRQPSFSLSVRAVSSSRGTSPNPTPPASASPSPLRRSINLPPISTQPRRETSSSSIRPPLGFDSSARRPSLTPSMHSYQSVLSLHSRNSKSPSERGGRIIGEGVLDDSDSEGSADERERSAEDENRARESDDDNGLDALFAGPFPPPRRVSTQPSPLSHVATRREWTDDDDEDERSASPASTENTDSEETGSDVAVASPRRKGSGSRSRTRKNAGITRSRSSTLASLPATAARRLLAHQESFSSIRTVTASGSPTASGRPSIARDETIRDLRSVTDIVHDSPQPMNRVLSESSTSHQRQHSESSPLGINHAEQEHRHGAATNGSIRQMSRKQLEAIGAEDQKLREMGWKALREYFEELADQGDVQMCAMLVLVVADDLKIRPRRSTSFVEAYLDMLSRLRLFSCAAYIRKHVAAEEIRSQTSLNTTIYTSCGRCRKAIVVPASAAQGMKAPNGQYSFCLKCQQFTVCSICHLPVKGQMYQCGICSHGGHQDCYRHYYAERPLADIPLRPTSIGRSRSKSCDRTSSIQDPDEDDTATTVGSSDSQRDIAFPISAARKTKIMGYPCAAGCGHFCWAAVETVRLK